MQNQTTKNNTSREIQKTHRVFGFPFLFLNLKSKILNLATVVGVVAVAGLFFFASANTIYAAILGKPPNNLGLVGYWSLNEGEGTTAGDFSGQGNDGDASNMEADDWVSGKLGAGLDYDNSDDQVLINHNGVLDDIDTISISVWLKVNSGGPGDSGRIVDKSPTNNDFLFAMSNSQQINFEARRWDTSEPSFRTDNGAIPLGEWVHVIVTYDYGSTDNDAVYYIDGELANVSQSGSAAGSVASTPGEVRIGNSDGLNRRFDGIIDEVRIYNRILSATEARDLYESGFKKINSSQNDKFTEGLIGLWSFNGEDMDFTSNTAYDRAGSSDGTLTNMSTTTSPTDGIVGQALDFDGSDDSILFGSSVDAGTEHTSAAWVYLDSYNSTTYVLGTSGNDGILGFGGSGQLNYRDGSGLDFAYGSSLVGRWHHIAIVRDGFDVSAYVDGVQIDTTQSLGSNDPISVDRIGSRGATTYLDGRIDEVRVYDRVFNADEINRLYRMGKATLSTTPKSKLTDGLVGYWTFDGPDTDWSTHTVTDLSGNSFTGTTTVMSTTSDPVPGRLGQALRFRGSNVPITGYHVDVGDFNHDIGTGDFTVSIHTKVLSDTGQSIQGFLGIHQFDPGFIYYLITGSQWGFYDETDYGSGGTLDIGRWYHLVVRRTGTTLEFFKDGVAEPSSYTFSDSIPNGDLQIGRPDNSRTRAVDAIIDDVRIYDRSLSLDEIIQLYRMGAEN